MWGHEVVTQELFFSAKTYFEKDHSCRYWKIKWQYFSVRLTMELCSRMRVLSPGPGPLSSKAHPTTVPSEVNDAVLWWCLQMSLAVAKKHLLIQGRRKITAWERIFLFKESLVINGNGLMESIFFCRKVKPASLYSGDVSCLLDWGVNIVKLLLCLPLVWLCMVLLSFGAFIQNPQVISFSFDTISFMATTHHLLYPIQIPYDSLLLLHGPMIVSFPLHVLFFFF